MRSVRTISSSVTPINVPSPSPTKNNFIGKKSKVTDHLKFIIAVEVALGINRIYLYRVAKCISFLCYIHCIMLILINVYFMFNSIKVGTTYFVVKNTMVLEYFSLIILVLVSVKIKLIKFFENLNQFDDILNIRNNLDLTSSSLKNFITVLLITLYNLCEYYLELEIFYDGTFTISHLYIVVVSLTHDIEQVFFLTLLRYIYFRLMILKAHTLKLFCSNDRDVAKLNKIEALSNKANLDVSKLHKVYELLHKSSCQFNSVMSVPLLIIFFASGITTVMLLKLFVNIFQMDNYSTNVTILYLILRSVKHTTLLVIPCYYSSVTNTEASIIRTTLHDAVNSKHLSKSNRRKVKTFFQLTRESDFSYALCGVIKLNMSLPLSYMSLCTTYLVIVIQFSKFID